MYIAYLYIMTNFAGSHGGLYIYKNALQFEVLNIVSPGIF